MQLLKNKQTVYFPPPPLCKSHNKLRGKGRTSVLAVKHRYLVSLLSVLPVNPVKCSWSQHWAETCWRLCSH